MNQVTINPAKLKGSVCVPPSKSLAHRAIICASLCRGISVINNVSMSKDISATIDCMRILDADIIISENSVRIDGTNTLLKKDNMLTLDCNESGSTIRFLIPLALLSGSAVTFIGGGKLPERPLDTYYELFKQHGIIYKNNNGFLPMTASGTFHPGKFEIPGNISSQFITGLLFILPLLNGNSEIIIKNALESKGYIDLTLDILSKYGIKIVNDDYKSFYIEGNQQYKPYDYTVEGDYSNACFWLAANVLGSDINITGLNEDSLQGDKIILNIIENIRNGELNGRQVEIDASQIPDMVPSLAVIAALGKGSVKIVNAARLRLKECDRLSAVTRELGRLGADIHELEDGLIIKGKDMLSGGETDSWNDHRIAMALAVAAVRCENSVIINGSSCVEKSYADFWQDYRKLGGNIYERSMG